MTLVEKLDEWYSTNLAKFAEVVEASRPAIANLRHLRRSARPG
jgi:hypothetical protein